MYAKISGGRSEFSVNLIPAEEFPQLSAPAADSVTLSAAEFSEGLRQVVSAASTDDSRPILTGVLLAAEGTGLRLVSTDSYRLAVRDPNAPPRAMCLFDSPEPTEPAVFVRGNPSRPGPPVAHELAVQPLIRRGHPVDEAPGAPVARPRSAEPQAQPQWLNEPTSTKPRRT